MITLFALWLMPAAAEETAPDILEEADGFEAGGSEENVTGEVIENDDTLDNTDAENVVVPEETKPDLIDRIVEMVDEGMIMEAVSLAAAVILAMLIYFLKNQLGKFVISIKGIGGTFSSKVDDSTENTKKVMGENAALLKEYVDNNASDFKKFVEENGKSIEEFAIHIDEKLAQVTADFEKKIEKVVQETNKAETILADLARMLDVVYMGSSTIPAVVKEKIMEIYEHASKTMQGETEGTNE